MARLTVIAVPYAAGRFEEGMGLGPTRYLEAGASAMLAEAATVSAKLNAAGAVVSTPLSWETVSVEIPVEKIEVLQWRNL
jgi:hypothetical protein